MDSENRKIPDDWELMTIDKIKANDKKAIISGPFGSNIGSRYFVESGIPVIRGNNLKADMTRFIDDGFVFLTLEKATELNTWAERNDLIFTAAGTIGQVGIIPKNSKYEKYIISNKQLRLRVNESIIRPLFAFYWFSCPIMVSYIQQRNTGSTIPLINLSVLRSLPIPVPPIDIQDRVINIVGSLDSKIALNRSMNTTIEAIGQALFKHWFINFEFPDGEGRPYRSSGGEMIETEFGSVPKGWKTEKLGEHIDVVKGCSYRSEDLQSSDKALVTLKSIERGGGFKLDGLKPYTGEYKQEQIISPGELVVAHTDLTQKAEVLGKPAIVRKVPSYSSLIASLDLSIVRSKNESTNIPFIYYLIKTEDFQNHAYGYADGTTVLHLSKKAIPEYKFVLPEKKLVKKFGELIIKLLNKIQNNELESEIAVSIRDALLPKLMSGEIKIR